MSKCSGCGGEVQGNERFCGRCGAAVAANSEAVEKTPGKVSKVELEPDLLNSLLAMYANKPDGPQVRLVDGRLQISLGDHAVDINPIRLDEAAQVLLKAGALGKLNLSIDMLELGQNGLELQVRLR